MIVSHKHKFVFLKTRKTGSTSVEMLLSRYCGEEDVITPIAADDEKNRAASGWRGAQNYFVPFRKYKLRDWARLCIKFRRAFYWSHMPAELVRARLGENIWNNYYKFCVERNPWDKAVSLYYWRTHEMAPRPSIADFLSSVDEGALSNYHIYAIGDERVVDNVIAYEDLTKDLACVMKRLGIYSDEAQVPKAKSGYRKNDRTYQELLTRKDEQLIRSGCSMEISEFSYQF